MSLPHTVQPMPVRGGYRKTEQPSYSHGGPAGSELGPVLNGVECCKCGKEMGKSYRAPGGKPWCGCIPHERWCELMADSQLTLTKDEKAAGWHFCIDWDGLLVGPGMMELDTCGCPGVAIERERRLIREAQC